MAVACCAAVGHRISRGFSNGTSKRTRTSARLNRPEFLGGSDLPPICRIWRLVRARVAVDDLRRIGTVDRLTGGLAIVGVRRLSKEVIGVPGRSRQRTAWLMCSARRSRLSSTAPWLSRPSVRGGEGNASDGVHTARAAAQTTLREMWSLSTRRTRLPYPRRPATHRRPRRSGDRVPAVHSNPLSIDLAAKTVRNQRLPYRPWPNARDAAGSGSSNASPSSTPSQDSVRQEPNPTALEALKTRRDLLE